MNREIWKDIGGYNGIYKISNYGNVISEFYKKGRHLKSSEDKNGYLIITLTKNNIHKYYKVHRLVFSAFIDKNNIDFITHKDNNIKNNFVDNLEKTNIRKCVSSGYIKSGKKTSIYTGVSFCKQTGKWKAQIQINSKNIFLGRHNNEIDAKVCYNNEFEKANK